MTAEAPEVSIVVPVFNKLAFTAQCLERLARHTAPAPAFEVLVIDNASSDETPRWFAGRRFPIPVRYHRNETNLGFAKANNLGARLALGRYLLFLNNDTIVQPSWLAEMYRVIRADLAVGIVGLKQLFPYTRSVYHTGVVFAPGGVPQHLYPHLDASLPQVNQEREYQAVNGACLLIERALFDDCQGFDEAYVNGYEDTDLCLKVRERGRTVVCCTSAFIYHYAQISEGRTQDDDANAALFASRWRDKVRIDRDEYLLRDRVLSRAPAAPAPRSRRLPDDAIYLADDLAHSSAFTWVNAELASALADLGVPVKIRASALSPTIPAAMRRRLQSLAIEGPVIGGTQIKWSHYWPRHLDVELHGRVNAEFFVTNYCFGAPGEEPWDYWSQTVRGNRRLKLPVSEFCAEVLGQLGVPEHERLVLHHGYSPEIRECERRPDGRRGFRFLTVTNSRDLDRYGTLATLTAFERAFAGRDDVTLVIKDYGAAPEVRTLPERLKQLTRCRIEYVTAFTSKRELIDLYCSCDAFVSAHRGEGFGMKILDAMACGLPVITTLFGGPTAYCDADNTYPVDFTLVPVTQGLDAQSLRLPNRPLWAEADVASLAAQMRTVVEFRAEAIRRGERGRQQVLERFSWAAVARRLAEIAASAQSALPRSPSTPPPAASHSGSAATASPYWLGLRISVVIPTHNRSAQLQRCLDALARQSILDDEFEVIVVDDGSTDDTAEAMASRRDRFALRYHRQPAAGPGAARNLGVSLAAGELVLFIGDDIYADERLLEEHLLAHAARPEITAAVLGFIDWAPNLVANAVMRYVTGEGMLQFAYDLIARSRQLDHRFFYTSNVSLKRQFLVEAAADSVAFDPDFRKAAFEDSEFAYRLLARGLDLQFAASARAVHDHWMDLESFARREHGAGEMAVVFYRKHPALDEQLQVRQVVDLLVPASALRQDTGLRQRLERFDDETDTLLRSLAASLEALMGVEGHDRLGHPAVSADRLRVAHQNVLRTIFDVARTRGKLQEWCAGAADQDLGRAARTLAAAMRKIEFLRGEMTAPGQWLGAQAGLDTGVVSALGERLASLPGAPRATAPGGGTVGRRLRQLLADPRIVARLIAVDRGIQNWLADPGRSAWHARYHRGRARLRRWLG